MGMAYLMLAATLAHEQVHNTDGEYAAYRLQADFLSSRLRELRSRERATALKYIHRMNVRSLIFGDVERRRKRVGR
jgi:hypothetical protein